MHDGNYSNSHQEQKQTHDPDEITALPSSPVQQLFTFESATGAVSQKLVHAA